MFFLSRLDLLKEGYEVYTIVDAVGGTSEVAHEIALRRMEQAGVRLTSVTQYICELQRDWSVRRLFLCLSRDCWIMVLSSLRPLRNDMSEGL